MRTIEEIRADIAKPYDFMSAEAKQRWTDYLDMELRAALTASIPLDRLEQICQAEREGRCVVLPCKVGESVFAESWDEKIFEYVVTGFETGQRYHVDGIAIHCHRAGYPGWQMTFDSFRIGKDVFLTHEAVEEARGEAEEC